MIEEGLQLKMVAAHVFVMSQIILEANIVKNIGRVFLRLAKMVAYALIEMMTLILAYILAIVAHIILAKIVQL